MFEIVLRLLATPFFRLVSAMDYLQLVCLSILLQSVPAALLFVGSRQTRNVRI